MNFKIENIDFDEIEKFKKDGFTIIYVADNTLHYGRDTESKEYLLPPRKKERDFYYVLTVSGNLIFTDNPKHYSKKVKIRQVSCLFDYNDELALKNDSYRFLLYIPEILFKRFKISVDGVATEVIVLKEQDVIEDIKTDIY